MLGIAAGNKFQRSQVQYYTGKKFTDIPKGTSNIHFNADVQKIRLT